MGQTLSEPITEKHTAAEGDERFLYAASGMQGWRISMEDAHAAVLELSPANASSHGPIAFFGVYDGHGGSAIAQHTGRHLHLRIAQTEEYQSGDYKLALKHGFLAHDSDLKNAPEFANDPSGCTAVAAIITPTTVYVANAGDSRAVLSVNGVAEAMSYDHKPVNTEEQNRILSAGGFVEFGRVNGNLALSRAIGDFEFKQNSSFPPEKQIVTADPDVKDFAVSDQCEFLILACDGIWDCMTNQEAIDFIRERIASGMEIPQIAEAMMDNCLATDSALGGVGCDNMTVVIVCFLEATCGKNTPPEKRKEEFYRVVKKRFDADAEKRRPHQQNATINNTSNSNNNSNTTTATTPSVPVSASLSSTSATAASSPPPSPPHSEPGASAIRSLLASPSDTGSPGTNTNANNVNGSDDDLTAGVGVGDFVGDPVPRTDGGTIVRKKSSSSAAGSGSNDPPKAVDTR